MRNTYKLLTPMLFTRAISIMLFSIFLIGSQPVYGSYGSDTAYVKWVPTQITSKVYKVKLQMKSRAAYKTGSFTIAFEHAEDALSVKSYASLAFKTGDYKNSLNSGSEGGSIIVNYKGSESNGATLNTTWTDIGEILYDVLDSTQTPELLTIPSNTILRTSGNKNEDYVALGTLNENGGALPVTWLLIQATSVKTVNADLVNKILWTTATETNNDRFEIQRSFLGTDENFSTVAIVKGQGTSMVITQYQTYDTIFNSFKGETIYYRIKQVDYSGAVSYSQIVKAVQVSREESLPKKIWLSYNPYMLHLGESPESPVHIVVHDQHAKELLKLESDKLSTILDIQNLTPGIYYVVVRNGSDQRIIKFVQL